MIAFAVGLFLVSMVAGLPRPEALPAADPEPVPAADPDPQPEAEADPYYGRGFGYPGRGVGLIEEELPPIFIEGVYEEVIVGPEYPGIHTLLG